jgi:hypothetical protein
MLKSESERLLGGQYFFNTKKVGVGIIEIRIKFFSKMNKVRIMLNHG